MRVALRADGGPKAGLGHLGRCAALAQAFEELGHRPVFVDVPATCRPWLAERGLEVSSGSQKFDVLVVDSYTTTATELARLRRRAGTLVLLDDYGRLAAPCDLLLNGNLGAASVRYEKFPAAGLLIGPAFALMRREYWKPAKPRKIGALKRLLVTLGGANLSLSAELASAAAAALPGLAVTAVLGPFQEEPPFSPGVHFMRNPPSLRPLLEWHDAVVLAGGQTIYEAAFTGAPMLSLQLGADQAGNAAALTKARAALSLGTANHGLKKRLVAALRALTMSKRVALSQAASGLVDGRGALRAAAAIAGVA